MNAFLLAGMLIAQPAPVTATEMEMTFRTQQAIAIRDIRIDIQADLERDGARFFSSQGGLSRILETARIVEHRLAAR